MLKALNLRLQRVENEVEKLFIITILTSPSSTTTPSLHAGNKTHNALLDIATVLRQATDLPTTVTKPFPGEGSKRL